VVVPGVLEFTDGGLRVPTGPGPGVEIDQDVLGRPHENYLTCGVALGMDFVAPAAVYHSVRAATPGRMPVTVRDRISSGGSTRPGPVA
jgi:hypothetical protein